MEFIYQALVVNFEFGNKHKTGCHKFPMRLGVFSYPHIQEAKVICDELVYLKLGLYTARKYYDPKHKMRALLPSVFDKHFNLLEDFWEDLQDEYDLRKKEL